MMSLDSKGINHLPPFKAFALVTQPCMTSRDMAPPSPSLLLNRPLLPSKAKNSSAMSETLPGRQVLSLPACFFLGWWWLWPDSY